MLMHLSAIAFQIGGGMYSMWFQLHFAAIF